MTSAYERSTTKHISGAGKTTKQNNYKETIQSLKQYNYHNKKLYQELVDAKIGIMSKAEQQEAMLMNHAEAARSLTPNPEQLRSQAYVRGNHL